MIRRLALAAAALTLLVLALGAAGLYWLLAGDGVRQALERQASAWLGEPVAIGQAGARLFPRVGIQLRDVRIGEPVRLTLASASLSTELMALLGRRVENADLELADSRIEFPLPSVRGSDGGAAAADTAAGPGLQVVSVRSIALRDIRVVNRGRELLVSADSRLEAGTLTIGRFSAQSGETSLEAEGLVQLTPRIDARLRVTANRLDVDELLALAQAFVPPAAAGESGAAAGLPGRIAARVSAEAARAGGVDVSQLATDFEIDGADVALSPISFQLFGGRYQGAINARLGDVMTASIRSRLMDLDVAQIAAYGGAPDTVTGRLTGAGTFSGEGADLGQVLASARGQGTAEIVDGSIRSLNLIRTVVLFFGRPAPDAQAGTDRFTRIDAKFSLADQRVRADALSLHSDDADIVGEGVLHTQSKALDGRFDLSLSEALSAQAGTDLMRYTREGNRVVLPAQLGGTLAAPRLTIDRDAALKRGLRNEVERRLKGLLNRFGAPSEP
jgi:uncharacterized protein involved in outer membrane biogenesis